MSLQDNKEILKTTFDVLKQQSSSTFENWDDPVQRRFYEQFINSLPAEFYAYLKELSKLDEKFKSVEQAINSLQQ